LIEQGISEIKNFKSTKKRACCINAPENRNCRGSVTGKRGVSSQERWGLDAGDPMSAIDTGSHKVWVVGCD